LKDIFMDLGAVTRELAPLKVRRPKGHKLKSKTILKVRVAWPQKEEAGEKNISEEDDLGAITDNHFFHNLVGLSNLRKGKESLSLTLVL
jgi:hypothetical protein